MINGTGNYNLPGNNLIGRNLLGRSNQPKTSVNKYYNIFTKKLEEIELPDVDLEHNTPMNPEISTFSRVG